jgi:hypothetical protein
MLLLLHENACVHSLEVNGCISCREGTRWAAGHLLETQLDAFIMVAVALLAAIVLLMVVLLMLRTVVVIVGSLRVVLILGTFRVVLRGITLVAWLIVAVIFVRSLVNFI